MSEPPLLRVSNLEVSYASGPPAVCGIEFTAEAGEVLAIVGESGSGKSTLGRAVVGLNPRNARTTGVIELDGEPLSGLTDREWSRIRGRRIGTVFQEAQEGLTPSQTVIRQVEEAALLGGRATRSEANERARDMLAAVGLDGPGAGGRDVGRRYPHELSGGMCQRVMIAMALINSPALLIADEPTSALDMTVQKRVLETLMALVADRGTTLVFISHDLGLMADISDRVLVLAGGRCVEAGPTAEVFTSPRHEATASMLEVVRRRETVLGGSS